VAHSKTFFNFFGVTFPKTFHNVVKGESQTMATKKATKKAATKKAVKKAAPKKAVAKKKAATKKK
jgi:hypothetical protein